MFGKRKRGTCGKCGVKEKNKKLDTQYHKLCFACQNSQQKQKIIDKIVPNEECAYPNLFKEELVLCSRKHPELIKIARAIYN